jgi:outer membrane protein
MFRCLPFLLVFSFVFPLSAQAVSRRVGYVDLRKALNEVEDGRMAKNKLQQKKSTYQTKLNDAQEMLKKEKKLFDRRSAILRGEAKRKAQMTLQKKFMELQQMYTKLTQELARDEAQETRVIFRKMEGIIRSIAEENRLHLVLEKTESSVLYALPAMDYTNDLIRRYNRIYGKDGKGGGVKKVSKKPKKRKK